MSVDTDGLRSNPSKMSHRTGEAGVAKKRKRKSTDSARPVSPTKKNKSKPQAAIPPATVHARQDGCLIPVLTQTTCPLYEETRSLYLPLAPICQNRPIQALCAEHISPLILSYYPPFHGVVISYNKARCHGGPQDISVTDSKRAVYAKATDEYAASFIWLTADFVIFRPQQGDTMEGHVTLQNENNLGLVCWNFFNCNIPKDQLPRDWKWSDAATTNERFIRKLKKTSETTTSEEDTDISPENPGTTVQEDGVFEAEAEESQHYFQDGTGTKVEGLLRFHVRHVETSRSAERESGFLSIEGTMLHAGLPAVQVLWNTEAPQLPNALSGASITVSQLLEQVNEIIPLESDDWGLEDYAVENQGFECFHFSPLGQVLKEDDAVCIRPLQSSDLRVRKFSGRHQIASDGKHLIDGVAFGRPFLKRADRPAVRIPPRKRRRITCEDPDDPTDEIEVLDRQVALRTAFNNTDERSDHANVPDYEGPPWAITGLEVDESSENGCTDAEPIGGETQRRVTRSQGKRVELGLESFGSGAYSNPLLDRLSQEDGGSPPRELHIGKVRADVQREDQVGGTFRKGSLSRKQVDRRISTESNKSVRFDENQSTTPATIQESEESDDEDDEDFDPADDNESDKENLEPGEGSVGVSDTSDSAATSSSGSDSTESEEDDTSSSGSSSPDSSDDSSVVVRKGKGSNAKTSRSDSDTSSSASTSTSMTSSDSSSVASIAKPDRPNTKHKPSSLLAKKGNKDSAREGSPRSKVQLHPTVAPGKGKTATQKRNQRRKLSARLVRLRDSGVLPENITTTADLCKHEETNGRIVLVKKVAVPATSMTENAVNSNVEAKTAAFEAKREALLQSIDSGGLDSELVAHTDDNDVQDLQGQVITKELNDAQDTKGIASEDTPAHDSRAVPYREPSSLHEHEQEPSHGNHEGSSSHRSENARTLTERIKRGADETLDPARVPVPSPPTGPQSEPALSIRRSPKQRSRLDLGSSKRLLFGALGVRTPKTKEEEIALREKLAKDVRPSKKIDEAPCVAPVTTELTPEYGDEDSWKAKIDLRAVECCQDGIRLSTPPFPFVQRWDPQQQLKNTPHKGDRKSKKGKKRKRNEQALHQQYEQSLAAGVSSKVRRQDDYNPATSQPAYDEKAKFGQYVNHDGPSDEDRHLQDSLAANEQLQRETSASIANIAIHAQRDSQDDLPPLPEDLSQLDALTRLSCVPGTMIAFKRFIMSAETNWQPCISEFVSATIDELAPDGTLYLTLAKRDQPQHEYQYNEKTGERVYGKFEMPDYDNEDDSADSSKLEVAFDELISPLYVCSLAKDLEEHVQNEHRQATEPSEVHNSLGETMVGDNAQRTATDGPASMGLDGSLEEQSSRAEVMDSHPIGEAREEIMALIRDAGWRSSWGSVIGKTMEPGGNSLQAQAQPQALEQEGSDRWTSVSPVSPERSSSFPIDENNTSPLPGPDDIHPHDSKREASKNSNVPSSGSMAKADVRYPALPASEDGEDSLFLQRQHRSVSFDQEDDVILTQDSISPPPIRQEDFAAEIPSDAISSIHDRAAPAETPSPEQAKGLDNHLMDSDDELPELFSQAFEARLSQKVIKSEQSSQQSDSWKSPIAKKQAKPKKQQNPKLSPPLAHKSTTENPQTGLDDSGFVRPSQLHTTQSSQIIDLTIPSDPIEAPEDISGVQGSDLPAPSGGWISKSKAKKSNAFPNKTKRKTVKSKVDSLRA